MGARRENGQGCIYQRGDGFVGKLLIGKKPDGRPSFKYFSGKTEAEVKRKIREYNKESRHVDAKKITVSDYAKTWLVVAKKNTVKQSTYDRLESTIDHQVTPYIGEIQLQKITDVDIKNWLDKLKDDGYSHSVVKKAYDCMGAVLTYAQIKDDVLKNPMLTVSMLSADAFEKKEIRFFTEIECRSIVEECERKYKTGSLVYPYGQAFILMMNTGIRMGEAIALKKSDWDKENKKLHVQRNAQVVRTRDSSGKLSTGSEVVYSSTKTYSGNRIIPLNENAIAALTALCATHEDSEFVICGATGNPIPHERIERSFYRVLDNIGIERTGLHSLRHTFASILFAKEVDVKTVSQLLGHANVQITYNTYIHLINNADHKAVAKLDNII